MTTIQNVTGTAFVVAELRAEENLEPVPLYRDPIVGLFLNEDTRRAAWRVSAGFPPAKDLIRIRTKYFDDTLDRELQSHVRQVVILGAGLDTRAVRKYSPSVTYFEIDDAETLYLKEVCYQRQGYGANLTFIPGNYVTDGLIELLGQNDFDFDLPTYVIWEGNTMYLPRDCTKLILTELRGYLKQFRVSFDYLAESVITKTTGDAAVTRLAESFANMGAPWVTGIENVETLARDTGLTVIENFRTSELHRAYGVGRPTTSPIFDFYSVCTLGR